MNINNFEGKITIDSIDRYFTYNDKILTVFSDNIKENWKDFSSIFYSDYKYTKKPLILAAMTTDNYSVTFIDVNLRYYGRGIYKAYIPAMIICTSNNYSDMPIAKDFFKMTFNGDCINKLYKISNTCVKTDIMELIKETTLNEDKLIFQHSYEKNENQQLNLESKLSIAFKETKNVETIKNYYEKIYKTMCFVFNRQCIKFTNISLFRKVNVTSHIIEKNMIKEITKEEEIQYKLITNDPIKDDIDLKDINIDLDILIKNFENLYNIINEKMPMLKYYPLNSYDNNTIDNYKFLKVASAFEGQFDILYPNFKSSSNEKYMEVKENLLKYIESEIEKDEQTNKGKKYLNLFKDDIDALEGRLSEQINAVLEEFNDSIKFLKIKILTEYKISEKNDNQISEAFQKKRNNIAHKAYEEYLTGIEIAGYLIVKILVHCLILKRANFDNEQIKKMINCIFR